MTRSITATAPSRGTLAAIRMTMVGTWNGKYRYDKLSEKETLFTIIITEFDGVNFVGTVTDDLVTGGTKGEGTIKGKLINGKIHFIKQMPVLTIYAKEKIIEAPKPHKPIEYTGEILTDNSFRGNWKIKSGPIFTKYFFAFGSTTTGTWDMTKI